MNKKYLGKIILIISILVFAFGFTMLVDAISADSFKRASLVIDCILTTFVGIGVAAFLLDKESVSMSGQKDKSLVTKPVKES